MIKNVVFDMGNVLINFDRGAFLGRNAMTAEEEKLLLKTVFLSKEWAMMDRGSITDEEAAEVFCSRLPENMHEAVRDLVLRWDQPIIPVEGMADLVRELAHKGYHIYLLSNASYRQHEYWPRIPGSEYFEQTLISADEHLVKPQPEIYLRLYEKCGIKAEESLFIDDVPMNVEASCYTGMDAFVFHGDVRELRQWLRDKGVSVNA